MPAVCRVFAILAILVAAAPVQADVFLKIQGKWETIEMELSFDEKAGTFELKPLNGPEKGMISKGIFKVGDGTLDLCFAAPGVEPPKEFKTKENVFWWSLKKK
jgi:hypothetical protein